MKSIRLITAILVGAGLVTAAAPSFAEGDHTFAANVGLYSQYVFRGITQTFEDPALQGGFDYSHASGFYLGAWGSNISWLQDANAYSSGGSLELDFYGGFKGSVSDFGYDVGLLQYWYPGDVASGYNKADTLEMYVAGSWKWFTVKYSYALSDKVFGYGPNADGSDYWDFSASVPVGESGVTLGAHYGIQSFKGSTSGVDNGNYEYNDWKISAAYDMGKASKTLTGVTVGIAYTDTDADANYWTVNGKNLGDSQFIAWVSKAF
jgi:uncharacterized protein (TIGR02001 family)